MRTIETRKQVRLSFIIATQIDWQVVPPDHALFDGSVRDAIAPVRPFFLR
jgi:predicted secreted protein